MNHRSSDESLLAAARLKQPQALEILYSRYAGLVMALCVRIVRDRGVAEQIVETVFLDIWNESQRFKGSLLNRLVSDARKIAIERRRAMPSADLAEMSPTQSDISNGPMQTNLRAQRARMQRALAEVPESARQILEMVYFDACDVKTVARRLKLTRESVREQLLTGLRVLRDALRTEAGVVNALAPTRRPLVNLDRH